MNISALFYSNRLFDLTPSNTFSFAIFIGIYLFIIFLIASIPSFFPKHLFGKENSKPKNMFTHKISVHFLLSSALGIFFLISRIAGIPFFSMRFFLEFTLLSQFALILYFLFEYFTQFEKYKATHLANKTRQSYLPKKNRWERTIKNAQNWKSYCNHIWKGWSW